MTHESKTLKNKLSDLNNHLFVQLERLNDETLDDETLQKEIERSKATTSVSTQVVNNARLVLDAQTRILDIPEKKELPEMLK